MTHSDADAAPRPRITLERTFPATLDEVWALWTTKSGIESWWGPEGFAVTVGMIDFRPGGAMQYVMTAVGPAQVAFMKQAGAPLSTHATINFTEILPLRRLGYVQLADFVPGVAPYEVATLVELQPVADGVRMVLTFDAMHDDVWTQRAVMGRESELERLAGVIGQPRSGT